jgi:uncharacterized protein (UPF0333 family)
MASRAQVSLELIIILAFMLGVFLAIIVSNNTVLSTTNARVNADKANTALTAVADAASLVYQQGSGAKSRVYVSIPENLFNSSVYNETLRLDLYAKEQKIQTVYRILDFDVDGRLPNASGTFWITVEAFDTYVNVSY